MEYIDQVVALLSAEFEWDDHVEEACRNALTRAFTDGAIPPRVEFICDHPVLSNWRLKSNPTVDRWALRMAYYGMSGDNPAAEGRAKQITDQLSALAAPFASR